MYYALAAVALAVVVFLLLRRRDSRIATIRSLPKYGTPDAAELQDAIARQGPARLLSGAGTAPSLIDIEPPRSEAYFRERLAKGGRPSTSPVARWHRARSKPVRPKPLPAPRPRPGPAPPPTILVHASRCRICGRPLTNLESRRRGLGPDCYRNYGARLVHASNPAFGEWSERKRSMEAQEALWQSLLDEMYELLMARFESEMLNWNSAAKKVA